MTEGSKAMTDHAQTMLELADRLRHLSDNTKVTHYKLISFELDKIERALRAHPAIGTPDNARKSLDRAHDRLYGFSSTPDDAREATRPSVNEYASEYEYRGDQDYVPTEGERAMIEDAIEGYLALAALPREQEAKPVAWQPIETFPRDGEAYLADDSRVDGGFAQVVYWHDETMRLWVSDAKISYLPGFFTHWMPLPAPPSDSPGSAHQPQGGYKDVWLELLEFCNNLKEENFQLRSLAHQPQGGDAREALFPPDIVEDGGKCITTLDASYNLQGALYDIKRYQSKKQPPDQVCINTIERVIEQLEKARDAFATPPAPVRAAAEPGEMREKLFHIIAPRFQSHPRETDFMYETVDLVLAALSPASANEGET